MGRRDEDIRIQVLYLTQLLLWVNAVDDTGDYDDITVEQVAEQVDRGTIISYLRDRLADAKVMGISLDEDAEAEITAAMQSLHDAVGVGYQFGVHRSGLKAVIAMCNEMVQQGAGDRTIRLPWSRR